MKNPNKLLAIVWIILMSSIFSSLAQSQPLLEPDESWTNTFLKGQKVGYSHDVIDKVYVDGRERFRIKSKTFMRSQRFGKALETRRETLTSFGAEETPESFSTIETQNGKKTKEIKGKFAGRKLHLTVIQVGRTKNLAMDIPADFADGDVVTAQMKKEGFKVGQKRTFKDFDSSTLTFSPITLEIVERKVVDFKGQKQDVFVVRTTESVAMQTLHSDAWILPDGSFLQLTIKEIGMRIEKTTREEALEEFPGLDIFLSSLVPSNVLLPSAGNIRKLEIKLFLESGSPEDYFPEDARQSLTSQSEDSLLIIQTQPFAAENSLTLPIPENAELEPFLLPTEYIQSDDKALVRRAYLIVAREKNAWLASKKLAKWVSENLTETYDVAFATAKEALDLKRGDCTEHAVLFVALARAAGIPAKVCSGLAYTSLGNFQYHAWAEVYVGQWVAIDPIYNQTEVDATHLKIFEGVLSAEEVQQFALQTLSLMDTLSLSVIKYETAEKATDVAQKQTPPPEIKGENYTNYDYGLKISRPNSKWMMTMDAPMQAILVMMVKATTDGLPMTASLLVEHPPQKVSLSEYRTQIEKNCKIMMQAYQKKDIKSVSLKGKEALEHTFTANIGNFPAQGRQLCFMLDDNTIIVLSLVGGVKSFAANKRKFDQIIKSLEFFKKHEQ